jgi:2-polyprenyl-3-methyl-5-hydroxy-6-metoxy-1,4-benzoquinol methylase
MFGPGIWDFYAGWYDRLWVQKFVLSPSRQLILKTIDTLAAPQRVLDVGCGIGELCQLISGQYPETKIVGIDPSSKMIRRAEMDFRSENITYVCGHTDSLSSGEQFDVIVSTNAFPYIPDKNKFLQDIKKQLKTNGRILLLFANQNTLYDAFWLRIVKLTTSRAQYLSVVETQNLLLSNGFKIGRTEPIDSLFFIPSVFMVEGIFVDLQDN